MEAILKYVFQTSNFSTLILESYSFTLSEDYSKQLRDLYESLASEFDH